MRRLSQRRVDSLKPRKATCEVRDAELKGFGIRVLPSGTRQYFVHHQHAGKRAWRTIGTADDMTEAQARNHAASVIAALGNGEGMPEPGDPLFEDVAEQVFRRYGRNWKPRMLAVHRGYLKKQILPYFTGRLISEITREDVQSWFSSLHATPVAADRRKQFLNGNGSPVKRRSRTLASDTGKSIPKPGRTRPKPTPGTTRRFIQRGGSNPMHHVGFLTVAYIRRSVLVIQRFA